MKTMFKRRQDSFAKKTPLVLCSNRSTCELEPARTSLGKFLSLSAGSAGAYNFEMPQRDSKVCRGSDTHADPRTQRRIRGERRVDDWIAEALMHPIDAAADGNAQARHLCDADLINLIQAPAYQGLDLMHWSLPGTTKRHPLCRATLCAR